MDSLEPRLPEDPGYWDTLATRITADARPMLAQNFEQRETWWSTLARGCPALAAAAGLAVVAGSILIASTTPALDDSPYAEVARALGPTDQVAQILLSETIPPRVETLLPVVHQRQGDR